MVELVNVAIVERVIEAARLRDAISRAPVTLLTGPRQAGKSTLVRQVVDSSPAAFIDLEDPRDRARLSEPTLALDNAKETIVIDEVQRVPDLFPVLRVLVDNNRQPGRFVILGSASPDLIWHQFRVSSWSSYLHGTIRISTRGCWLQQY